MPDVYGFDHSDRTLDKEKDLISVKDEGICNGAFIKCTGIDASKYRIGFNPNFFVFSNTCTQFHLFKKRQETANNYYRYACMTYKDKELRMYVVKPDCFLETTSVISKTASKNRVLSNEKPISSINDPRLANEGYTIVKGVSLTNPQIENFRDSPRIIISYSIKSGNNK